jgi:ABC-type sugar transport system substrate-binding protein
MSYKPRHRSFALRALAATCLGAVTFVAAACSSSGGSSSAGGSSSGGSSSSSGSGSGSSSELTAANADVSQHTKQVSSYPAQQTISGVSQLKGKSVWYVPIGASVPILAAFGSGMQQALAKVGISYHVCDGKFVPTNAAACISQAETNGASAVVTGYIDYASMPTSFNSLVAHHIPVLIAGEAPDGGKTSNAQLAFFNAIGTLDLMQKLDMDAVIADSKGQAHIIYLGVTDSPQTLAGASYGKQYLTSHCSGCQLTEINYNTASINKVPSQVSSALISHPDTTYVVDELDAAAQYSVQGIQSAGYTNKVKLAATNGALDSLERVKAGTVQFVDIGTSPIYEGWQFAGGILAMLQGQTPTFTPGVVRVFNSGTVKDLTLTPGAYTTNAWYGSDAYEQTFLTAWGVK